MEKQGQVRVGRIYYSGNQRVYPNYPDFTQIVVLTKSSEYGMLGPYELRDEKGHIMENLYQFSKLYPKTPEVKIPYTQRNRKIVWEYPETQFVDNNGIILPAYREWRIKGMNNPFPVRYPVSMDYRKNCLGAIAKLNNGATQLFTYAESRRHIYFPLYKNLVTKVEEFTILRKRLQSGENLLILETDGPHQESLGYYMETYNVSQDFIDRNTMLATKNNIEIMLNDTKHSFGHGYCLATCLLDINL
jgi:hypothetical protein